MLEHTKRQVKVLFLCRNEFTFPFVSHRILLFVSSILSQLHASFPGTWLNSNTKDVTDNTKLSLRFVSYAQNRLRQL